MKTKLRLLLTGTIITFSLLIIGCNNNNLDNINNETNIIQLLNIQESFETHIWQNTSLLYDTINKEIILPSTYCNYDFECVNWINIENNCLNKIYVTNDPKYKNTIKRYEELNLSMNTNCICNNNQCQFNGEPYTWIKENLPEKSNIMMWWDHGKFFEHTNMNPIIKNPSKKSQKFLDINTENTPSKQLNKEIKREWETDEKIKDVLTFLLTENTTEAFEILKKYEINYIYIDHHTYNLKETLKFISDKYKYKHIHLTYTDHITYNYENTILEKLYHLKKDEINYINLIYTHKRHKDPNLSIHIYEVKYPD